MSDRITLALHAPEDFIRQMTSFLGTEAREQIIGPQPEPDSRITDNPPEIELAYI